MIKRLPTEFMDDIEDESLLHQCAKYGYNDTLEYIILTYKQRMIQSLMKTRHSIDVDEQNFDQTPKHLGPRLVLANKIEVVSQAAAGRASPRRESFLHEQPSSRGMRCRTGGALVAW